MFIAETDQNNSAATARLNFVSDHYGRQARRFHPGHLTAVEDLSVGSYKAAMVQLEHSHYGGGGSVSQRSLQVTLSSLLKIDEVLGC